MLDRIALYCALLSCSCAGAWMWIVAVEDYNGNWTAFFRTGSLTRLPRTAGMVNLYVGPDPRSGGYDGQYYRMIAEDPFLLRHTEDYIDSPRLRYRRILVPALAYVAAIGRMDYISASYITVVILFLALGAYWLSLYSAVIGRSRWWGLAFVLAPAAFLSLDRLTVDIALAALTIAFALYWKTGKLLPLYAVLLIAPLARETGVLLIAAYVLYELLQKRWTRAALVTTSGIPAALWFVYVHAHTRPDMTAWIQWPFSALLDGLRNPGLFPHRPDYVIMLDDIAWLGMAMAIVLAIARWKQPDPLSRAALFFAVLASTIDFNVWQEVEGYGRAFTPLLLLLPLAWPSRWAFLPLALILPRALIFPASETVSALFHWLLH